MKPFKFPTRFTKRMMLLLVLFACGLSSYADGYSDKGNVEINGVKYHLYEYEFTWPFASSSTIYHYAYVEKFTGTSTEIVIPKTIKNGSTTYSVEGLRYNPRLYLKTATLSSSYVQTIRFEGSIGLYPGSNNPTFNCPNLRYIYFEGASPSFSDSYESYFVSPAKNTLTVYLSDKTAQEIAEMTTNTAVWCDFLHVYPLPNTSVKRNVNLSISRARVQIGDNYYVNDKALQVDMNSDLTFKVFKGYDTYQAESVKLNGMEILGEMEYTNGGADYLSYYTYTLPNVTSDAYITVTGVNTKYEVNVICNNGGTITSPHANTSVIIPNNRASIRWFKTDGDTYMTIIPNEGYTLDKLYYNSYDNTYRATANADGTFTYPLSADADISVVFKEIDPTIDWNVTLMGNVSVTAQFMDKRGAWTSFKDIVAGTNPVIDNAQRMNMTILPPENATGTLVVLADGVDLSSYFTSSWSWDYERECYSTEDAQESIPAEYLKATDWVIGIKSNSDSFVWTLKAVGNMGASTAQMVLNSGNQTWNVSSDERSATNVVPGITRLNHSLTIQLASHYSFTASFNGTDYTTSFVAGTVADGKVPYTFNMALGEPENAGMLVDGTWTITFTEESTENLIEWTAMAVGDVAEGLQSASFSLDDDLILVMLSQNSQSENDTYPIEESSGQIGFYIGASVVVRKGCDFRVWFNGTECTDKFIKQETTSNIETWRFTSNNASIVAPYATSGTWLVEFNKPADIIEFADTVVKRICVENWDTDHDGELSMKEAAAVTTLKVDGTSVFYNNTTITSFDELQYFTGLTKIENSALYGCRSLKSICLPSTITYLDNYGFYDCNSLATIILPESLTYIGFCAFYCSNLNYIYIPKSVSSITQGAFMNLNTTISIAVDPNNQNFDSREGCNAIIKKNGNMLVTGCKNTIIPEGITSIQSRAFAGNASITSLEIPASVVSIGEYAFSQCTGMTSLVMKNTDPTTITVGTNALTYRNNWSTKCTLTVPYGKKQAYINAGWTDGSDGNTAIFKEIVEAPSDFDVNSDGEVNVSDVTSLVNKILHP